MSYSCEVKEMPAQTVLTVRTRTNVQSLPQFFGMAYGSIMQHLGKLGELPAGPAFAAYYNMDMENLDVAAGFPVAKKLNGDGDKVQAGEMPAGKYAACLHVGPYDTIAPAYNALIAWMQEHEYEATGIAYEVYLNDPAETPRTELKTQVMFPIKLS